MTLIGSVTNYVQLHATGKRNFQNNSKIRTGNVEHRNPTLRYSLRSQIVVISTSLLN
jgi:hypothetical protein